MYYFRPSHERGQARFGWLDSKHTFSFGHYYDPKHMGFSALRVINDDTVKAGAGFDAHGHRDMEIISYILEGAIEHRDSEGNHFVVPAGEIQRMSAGKGITHSEYNHSKTKNLKFLQIWIQPNRKNIQPSYEQRAITQTGALTPLVTPNGRDNSLTIHQNASLFRLQLRAGERLKLDTLKRPGYLHIITGNAELNGSHRLVAGDGLGVYREKIELTASENDLIALWFDLPR
ncbi:pirin family protein [Microbulbifer sp. JTAC008]|uniref:pirin family protein n=1 Tax=unclassified Microbulbifer TaxID=2619833 RepID=UPI0040396921